MLLKDISGSPDDTLVCWCSDVTLGEIRRAIEAGARTLSDIQAATHACTGNRCEELNPGGGCCETDITRILAHYAGARPERPGGCGCRRG